MDTNLPSNPQFIKDYNKHRKHLKLNGLQPKTIDAYSRAIRRIGNYFDCQLYDLTMDQLVDYFTDLLESHSWNTVKLDLYGLRFFYTKVLNKDWQDIVDSHFNLMEII
jgi:site-specific recombinase XerD